MREREGEREGERGGIRKLVGDSSPVNHKELY